MKNIIVSCLPLLGILLQISVSESAVERQKSSLLKNLGGYNRQNSLAIRQKESEEAEKEKARNAEKAGIRASLRQKSAKNSEEEQNKLKEGETISNEENNNINTDEVLKKAEEERKKRHESKFGPEAQKRKLDEINKRRKEEEDENEVKETSNEEKPEHGDEFEVELCGPNCRHVKQGGGKH